MYRRQQGALSQANRYLVYRKQQCVSLEEEPIPRERDWFQGIHRGSCSAVVDPCEKLSRQGFPSQVVLCSCGSKCVANNHVTGCEYFNGILDVCRKLRCFKKACFFSMKLDIPILLLVQTQYFFLRWSTNNHKP